MMTTFFRVRTNVFFFFFFSIEIVRIRHPQRNTINNWSQILCILVLKLTLVIVWLQLWFYWIRFPSRDCTIDFYWTLSHSVRTFKHSEYINSLNVMGDCVIASMLHFASSSFVRYYCSLDIFMNVRTTDGYLRIGSLCHRWPYTMKIVFMYCLRSRWLRTSTKKIEEAKIITITKAGRKRDKNKRRSTLACAVL